MLKCKHCRHPHSHNMDFTGACEQYSQYLRLQIKPKVTIHYKQKVWIFFRWGGPGSTIIVGLNKCAVQQKERLQFHLHIKLKLKFYLQLLTTQSDCTLPNRGPSLSEEERKRKKKKQRPEQGQRFHACLAFFVVMVSCCKCGTKWT